MTQPQQHYDVTDDDFDFIWKNIDSPLVVRDRINVIKTRSNSYQSERDLPDVLVCQSLPNEHGFCGENDCFCKELHRVESGDICKWMQKLRQAGE